MLAWDLFVHISNRYKNERSVYVTGQVLQPAFEVSAIFGRQLLNFLKIKKNNKNELIEFIGKGKDDLTIDCIYPSMTSFPLQDNLAQTNQNDLLTLIKVADKAIAHFTKEPTTDEEFQSLKNARMVIYELILKYFPDIINTPNYKTEIRWMDRDNYTDAIIQ